MTIREYRGRELVVFAEWRCCGVEVAGDAGSVNAGGVHGEVRLLQLRFVSECGVCEMHA